MESTSSTLAELARANPAATRVFFRYRLDFCCAGDRTLAEACARAGLDPEIIAREIDAESFRASDGPDWEKRSQSELLDHIMARYHEALRRDFPPLIEAARRVEHVHAGKPAVPVGLAEELAAFWSEMESHMFREEQIIFPVIRDGAAGSQLPVTVRVMRSEHHDHARSLARIRKLTGDLEIPAHACATWRALYEGLCASERDVMEHIHLEDNVVFRRAVREIEARG
jgi:regulator of cell morphogenesis and NO signaling